MLLQSVCKLRNQDGDKHYPQTYLEGCKCTEKKPEKSKIRRKLLVPE